MRVASAGLVLAVLVVLWSWPSAVESVAGSAPAGRSAAPTVTVTATDAMASEADPSDAAAVEIRRSGNVDAALAVNYIVLYSSAHRVQDYVHPGRDTPSGSAAVTSTATIPAGAATVSLPFVAKDDRISEGGEDIVVVVSHKRESYRVGDPDRATVEIVDDEAPTPPAPPAGLSATGVSETQVNLAWRDEAANETAFTIEARPDGAPAFAVIATAPARTASYSVTGLAPGTTATYRVAALNEVGASGFSNEAAATAAPVAAPPWLRQVTVAAEPGRFKGWPVNGGMWSWDDEIVVMYEDGTFDQSSAPHALEFEKPVAVEQARSRDGGQTWTVEKQRPFRKPGAPGYPRDGLYGPEITDLPEPVDFEHPDFALHVRMSNKDYGEAYWYYSYDRARTWNGPYWLPDFGYPTVNARTDYIVNSRDEILLFLSGTPNPNNEADSRIFVARSTDGGMTWTLASRRRVADTIQASSVRLSPTELLFASRDGGVYASDDNGETWTQRSAISVPGSSTPRHLVRLPDGRLVVTYGYRAAPFGVRAQVSFDDGFTWQNEVVLRQDGGSTDLGYARSVVRPDGKIVTTYYFNSDPAAERTIEATIWDPDEAFPAAREATAP